MWLGDDGEDEALSEAGEDNGSAAPIQAGMANGHAGEALSQKGAVLKRLQELPEDLSIAQPGVFGTAS